MATAAEKTQEIIERSRGHNRGDVALGRRPNQERSSKQRLVLRANIEPGDLINREHPEDNYQFAWVPLSDVHFYHDLKDEGYKVVVEAEWVNTRETREWATPEKDKWRWASTRMLMNRDEFAMYRNEDMWEIEKANRLQLSNVDQYKEAAIEKAAKISGDSGVEVEIESNGRPNVAGVRRTTVS